MGDVSQSDPESGNPSPDRGEQPDLDRHPFGGLEFQVSEVVGRLEAGVNAQESHDGEKRRESRKISAGFFEPEETEMDELLRVLEELVLKTDPNCESVEPPLLPTDAVTRAAILSHSAAALFGRLERSHAARLGAHIASETTRWMSHMFRLPDYHAFYHHEQLEGLVRVTRMLLHHRYPRYLEDGALALSSRLPCVYSCVASALGVVQTLCRQLSLPLACVRPVPVDANTGGMDAEELSRMCTADIAAGRVPLICVSEAGGPPLGARANLPALRRTATAAGAYLHVHGHALALPAAIGTDQVFDIADSVTLTPGPWFGVPSLPTVTFYRIPEPISSADITKGVNASGRSGALSALSGLSGGEARLPALPLWAALRAAGGQRLQERLADAFASAREVHNVVAGAGLRLLSGRPGGDEPPNVDLAEAVGGACGCVSFQFAPAEGGKPPPYYDKLNSWLGQVLQREADMINLEVCETESTGVVVRYCPLEGCPAPRGATTEWAAALDAQLHVVRATLALREPFQKAAAEHPRLRLCHVPGWAGLGGVRYVPAGWEGADAEVGALNRQLVDRLRATDGAFSCGDGEDGVACVRFGMVTADSDVDELLELVVSAGAAVEESSRALDDMTEVLKKGIEAAVADLERESAERLWQEGLLRRVPVVGRVVGWWAPPAPPPTGRRLHLASGTLQTTADIYRYVQTPKGKESNEPARAHSPARQPAPAPDPTEHHPTQETVASPSEG